MAMINESRKAKTRDKRREHEGWNEEEERNEKMEKVCNPHRTEKYGFYLENREGRRGGEGSLDNCVINYSFYPAARVGSWKTKLRYLLCRPSTWAIVIYVRPGN